MYTPVQPIRTVLELERSAAGHLYVSATEYDAEDYGIRSYILSDGGGTYSDAAMVRIYHDLCRLTRGNASFVLSLEEA